jgi:cytochrome c biogenesis protein CcmG/thiol:disulfide interchange protein DsbE
MLLRRAKMRKLLLCLPILFFAIFTSFAFVAMQRDDPNALPSTAVGQSAPAVQLQTLEGNIPFGQNDLAAAGVKLVNFWASWCAPCRAEHSTLMDLSRQGIPVYGVNYKDDPAKALAFLHELGNPYTLAGTDPDAKMALDWGVYGLPETFILGSNGTVLLRVTGPLTQRNLETRVLPAVKAAGLGFPNLITPRN